MHDSAVVSKTAVAASSAFRRRLPVGAEPIGDGRTHVRVWAPDVDRLECVVSARGEEQTTALVRESEGYFSGVIGGEAGDRSQFLLDTAAKTHPDPALRCLR